MEAPDMSREAGPGSEETRRCGRRSSSPPHSLIRLCGLEIALSSHGTGRLQAGPEEPGPLKTTIKSITGGQFNFMTSFSSFM
ncbi:hypothetical protein EYF80_042464 [Liparis tanakae]|uniref:Uncharacterized protein n=1 Tax=Liparis tanakae TaxID=230148 RepID=A0A4Z2G1G6_9TELE|nr:hypothetical protein EYF80_042464 [Liparis tanakae]